MKIASLFRVLIPLGLSALLFYWVAKDINWQETGVALAEANYFWVAISAIFMVAAHLVRANRWLKLLSPLGYQITTSTSFLAVMAGYGANLLLPRAGEIARCGLLQHKTGVPAEKSFGTVIAERTIDFLMLIIFFLIALGFEAERLLNLLVSWLPASENSSGGLGDKLNNPVVLGFIVSLLILAVTIAVFYKKLLRLTESGIGAKIWAFLMGLKDGLFSIFKLNNPWGFLFESFLIWFGYALSSYFVMVGFGPTAHLGLGASFVLLAIGTLGMIAPVQGGIGAYHGIIALGLPAIYPEVSSAQAFQLALLLHGSQTLISILIGGYSFFALRRGKAVSVQA